jgi:hypothetical protein
MQAILSAFLLTAMGVAGVPAQTTPPPAFRPYEVNASDAPLHLMPQSKRSR